MNFFTINNETATHKPTALITGASRGIGQAIAIAFAQAGYQLVITCSKSEAELLSLKQLLIEHYDVNALTSVGDIGNYSYVYQLFQSIEEHFGGIDILVNNAGISYVGLLTDMTIDDWRHIVNTNLTFPPATEAVLVSSSSTARAFTSVISTSVLTGKTVISLLSPWSRES